MAATPDDARRPPPIAIVSAPLDPAAIPGDELICARDLVAPAAPLLWDETNGAAFRHLSERIEQPCAAVVDERNRVLGLIDRGKLLATFGQTFGRSIYEKRPVSSLMDRKALVVDEDLDIDEITRLIADEFSEAINVGFLVSRDGRYVGIGKPIALLSKRRERSQKRAMELETLNKAIEKANEAKSAFLATMSHELRTPLNGVIGNLELLRLKGLRPDQSELVDNAQISAETLLGVIGDILDFSKIEAGRIDIEHVETAPAQVLSDVEALLTSKATAKGLFLRTYVAPDVPDMALTDGFRLKQVVMNFVSNALKFTESGGLVLSLSAKDDPDRPGWMRLRYECVDTGAGFAPERAHALFDAFTQEDSSTTRKYGGTGLGLAICKTIANLMGGDIGAAGAPGCGAKFWCEIPVERSAGATRDAPAIDLSGLSILYVAATALDAPLGQGARDVVGVTSLDDALAHLDAAKVAGDGFDVVIAHDDRLPDGDDGALARAADGAALVLIDGKGRAETPMRAYRAGYWLALRAPLDATSLNHAIAYAAGRIERSRQDEQRENVSALASEMRASGAGRRVLVIDDTTMNRAVARAQLQAFGCEIVEAENGLKGLEIALAERFAVIFADCNMPVMDGFEFSRRLRSAEKANLALGHTPIVAMTGNALEGDRQRCLDAGMDDYVTKPVTLKRLAEALERWGDENLDHEPARTPAKPQNRHSGEPIDLDALSALLGEDDPAELAEMLDLFVETFPDLIDRLDAAISAKDAAATRDAAHAAKSAARNAAAQGLGELMDAIESAAEADGVATLKTYAAEARAIFEAAKGQVSGFARCGAAA